MPSAAHRLVAEALRVALGNVLEDVRPECVHLSAVWRGCVAVEGVKLAADARRHVAAPGVRVDSAVANRLELRVGLLAGRGDEGGDGNDAVAPLFVAALTGVRVALSADVDMSSAAAATVSASAQARQSGGTKPPSVSQAGYSTFVNLFRVFVRFGLAMLMFARDAALQRVRIRVNDVSVRAHVISGAKQSNLAKDAIVELTLGGLTLGGGGGEVAARLERAAVSLDDERGKSAASLFLPRAVASAQLGASVDVAFNLPDGFDTRLSVQGAAVLAALADAATRAAARARYGVPKDARSRWKAAWRIAANELRVLHAPHLDDPNGRLATEAQALAEAEEEALATARGRAAAAALAQLAHRLQSALLLRREYSDPQGAMDTESKRRQTESSEKKGDPRSSNPVRVFASRARIAIGDADMVFDDVNVMVKGGETYATAKRSRCEAVGAQPKHPLFTIANDVRGIENVAVLLRADSEGASLAVGTIEVTNPLALAATLPSAGACVSAFLSSDWHNVQRAMALSALPSDAARLRARAALFAAAPPTVLPLGIDVRGVAARLDANQGCSAEAKVGQIRLAISPPSSTAHRAAHLAKRDAANFASPAEVVTAEHTLMARVHLNVESVDASMDGPGAAMRVALPQGVTLDAFVPVLPFDGLVHAPDVSLRIVGGVSAHADVDAEGGVQRLVTAGTALAKAMLASLPRESASLCAGVGEPPPEAPPGSLEWRLDPPSAGRWAARLTLRQAEVAVADFELFNASGASRIDGLPNGSAQVDSAWLGVAATRDARGCAPALAVGIVHAAVSWEGSNSLTVSVERTAVQSMAVTSLRGTAQDASEMLPAILRHARCARKGCEALVVETIRCFYSAGTAPELQASVSRVHTQLEATGAWACTRLLDVAKTMHVPAHAERTLNSSPPTIRTNASPQMTWSVDIGSTVVRVAAPATYVRIGSPNVNALDVATCMELVVMSIDARGDGPEFTSVHMDMSGVSACHFNERARAWEPLVAPFDVALDCTDDGTAHHAVISAIEITVTPSCASAVAALAAEGATRWTQLDVGIVDTLGIEAVGMGSAGGVGVAIAAPLEAVSAARRFGGVHVFASARAREAAGYFDAKAPSSLSIAGCPAPILETPTRSNGVTAATTASEGEEHGKGGALYRVHALFIEERVPAPLPLLAAPSPIRQGEAASDTSDDTKTSVTPQSDASDVALDDVMPWPTTPQGGRVVTTRVASAAALVLATEAAATAARALTFRTAAAVASAVTPMVPSPKMPSPPIARRRDAKRGRQSLFVHIAHIGVSVLDTIGAELLYARATSLDMRASSSTDHATGAFAIAVASIAVDDTRGDGHAVVLRWGTIDPDTVPGNERAVSASVAQAHGREHGNSITQRLSDALEHVRIAHWISPRLSAMHIQASWFPSMTKQGASAAVSASASAARVELLLDVSLATAIVDAYKSTKTARRRALPRSGSRTITPDEAFRDAAQGPAFVIKELSVAPLTATISAHVGDGATPLRGMGLEPQAVALVVALATLERFEMHFERTTFRDEDDGAPLLRRAALHYGRKLAATIPRALANAAAFGRVEATLRELCHAAADVARTPLEAYRVSLAGPANDKINAPLQRHARAVTAAAAGVARGAGNFAHGAASACLASASVATEAWRLAAAQLADSLPAPYAAAAASSATYVFTLWGTILRRLRGDVGGLRSVNHRGVPIRPPRLTAPRYGNRLPSAAGPSLPPAAREYDVLGSTAADAARRCPRGPPDAALLVDGAADVLLCREGGQRGLAVLTAEDHLLVCGVDAEGLPLPHDGVWRRCGDVVCIRRHGATVRAVFMGTSIGLKALHALRLECVGGVPAARWLERALGGATVQGLQ